MKKYSLHLIFLLLSLAMIWNCARQIAPVGGAKDIDPPAVVESDPEMNSTFFNRKKFEITFDEYIQLKNVNQELLISPLVVDEPEILLKGKKMVVKFNDTIPDSTTVNFNFHDAIADFNEGNIKTNFQYVFSTGPTLDTLFVLGNIRNAFDHAPIENAFVMFYAEHHDTMPMTTLPSFICKTDVFGNFRFNNIAEGRYKIFALSDANYNKLFDLPTEQIAYLDTLIEPAVELRFTPDTIDIVSEYGDTLVRDSIITIIETISSIDTLQLFMFEEYHPVQYLVDSKRDEEGKKIVFYFNQGLLKPLDLYPINFEPEKEWILLEGNAELDTLEYWISDTALVQKDTLILGVEYYQFDSLGQPELNLDTLKFTYKKKEEKKERGGLFNRFREEKDTIVKSPLTFRTNTSKRVLELEKNIRLELKYPVVEYSKEKIHLYYIEDTLENPVEFEIHRDTINTRTFAIHYPFIEREMYKLLIDTMAFKDIYGNGNDTLIQNFRVRDEDYYGLIRLTLKGMQTHSLLQLMDEKEKLLREFPVDTTSNILEIKLLSPGKYRLKLFEDSNANGEWDTGKYIENRQPEMVYYFSDVITIKSGWDNEIEWDLETTPLKKIDDKRKGKK